MKKPKKINLTVWIGVLLITVAFSIWLYSIIEIQSNKFLLATQDLGVEEVWLYEGALQWWKNAYWTAILPTWGILTISGIVTILSPQLRGFTQKVALKKPGLTVFEEEAVSRQDNVEEEPTVVMQDLTREEANLKEAKKKLAALREKLQLNVEEDIESKENIIQKLRVEINDLQFISEELSKLPRLAQK